MLEYELREFKFVNLQLSELRREDGPYIDNLAFLIKKYGLKNSPYIRTDGWVITGNKRIRAVMKAFPQADRIAAYAVPTGLAHEDYEYIALSEELKKEDLQWPDQVMLYYHWHEMRCRQFGDSGKGKARLLGWRIKDTAKELNIAVGNLCEDLRLAQAMLNNPALKQITHKTDAKILALKGSDI